MARSKFQPSHVFDAVGKLDGHRTRHLWHRARRIFFQGMIERVGDERWMDLALEEARAAAQAGEVPVGAVIVRASEAIARASNRTLRDQDPTAHAELLAIREASRSLRSWRLEGCTLYVSLEPCAMCAGGIVLARLDRLVFGAWDEKAGMVGSVGDLVRHPKLNHRPEVLAGVRADTCSALLTQFFEARRARGG